MGRGGGSAHEGPWQGPSADDSSSPERGSCRIPFWSQIHVLRDTGGGGGAELRAHGMTLAPAEHLRTLSRPEAARFVIDSAGTNRRSLMPTVLGIDVDAALLARWRQWYAPALQPFPLDDLSAQVAAQIPHRQHSASTEHRDTFFLYSGTWTWLAETEFRALPPNAQRALATARRRHMRQHPSPVWPAAPPADAALLDWVQAGMRPSDHAQVTDATWQRSRDVLPEAQSLASTFASCGSGANCFATVVAAADGAEHQERWMQLEEFSTWLAERTAPLTGPGASTRRDADAGTVLVWHQQGELAHAAVTLGDGWVLNKPSKSWGSPRLVWPVRHLVHHWRFPGARLSRYVLR